MIIAILLWIYSASVVVNLCLLGYWLYDDPSSFEYIDYYSMFTIALFILIPIFNTYIIVDGIVMEYNSYKRRRR